MLGRSSATPRVAEPVADARHEPLRRRCARRDADRLDAVEPRLVDLADVVDQMRGDARGVRDLDEPLRVRRVRRADHEQQVDLVEQLLHRPLPVRRRVADVFLRRLFDPREAAAQHVDDLARLVDRERGLRDVREPPPVGQLDRLGVGDRLDEDDRVRRLAHRAHDLLVARVADEDDRVARIGVAAGLGVHLRHERAGRVDRRQPPRVRGRAAPPARPRERRRRPSRPPARPRRESTKIGAELLELAHDVRVVDDLLADVDGRAVELEAHARPCRRPARPRRNSRGATPEEPASPKRGPG